MSNPRVSLGRHFGDDFIGSLNDAQPFMLDCSEMKLIPASALHLKTHHAFCHHDHARLCVRICVCVREATVK